MNIFDQEEMTALLKGLERMIILGDDARTFEGVVAEYHDDGDHWWIQGEPFVVAADQTEDWLGRRATHWRAVEAALRHLLDGLNGKRVRVIVEVLP